MTTDAQPHAQDSNMSDAPGNLETQLNNLA